MEYLYNVAIHEATFLSKKENLIISNSVALWTTHILYLICNIHGAYKSGYCTKNYEILQLQKGLSENIVVARNAFQIFISYLII